MKTEEQLYRLMRGGNEAAFNELYSRLHQKIYRFALNMSGSKSMAEDVTHDVFLLLIEQKRDTFDESKGAIRSYLYGIARHCVIDRLRDEHSFEQIEDDEISGYVDFQDPFGEMSRAERIERVQKAVLTLPAPYREVLALCELEELSYQEVSSILNCAIGTVRSRLHRARALLWKKLSQSEKEGSRESTYQRRSYEMRAVR